jgi:Uncharacterized conserved protein (DUF2285)/Family of unknown function (DUF6499)
VTFSTYRISRSAFPHHNPDWRSPYSYVNKLDHEAIAFEFLRRDHSYWRAYAEVMGLTSEPSSWPTDSGILYDPLGVHRPNFQRFGIRAFCDPRQRLPPLSHAWSLNLSLSARYVNAIERADARNDFDYSFRHSPRETMRLDLPIDGPTMRVDLPVYGPLDDTVEFVRWLLKRAQKSCWKEQKTTPRPSLRLFPRYLALLDARSDGASFPTIAKQFECAKSDSELDKLKKQHKVAVKLRDGEYRYLLRWGKISVPAHLAVRDHPF